MELHVLLWILGGGFGGTWGLCIFFMNRSDNAVQQMRNDVNRDIIEIRKEISELHKCVLEIHHCFKDHHGRISVIEEKVK